MADCDSKNLDEETPAVFSTTSIPLSSGSAQPTTATKSEEPSVAQEPDFSLSAEPLMEQELDASQSEEPSKVEGVDDVLNVGLSVVVSTLNFDLPLLEDESNIPDLQGSTIEQRFLIRSVPIGERSLKFARDMPTDSARKIALRPRLDMSASDYEQFRMLRDGFDFLAGRLNEYQEMYQTLSQELSVEHAPDIKMVQNSLEWIKKIFSEEDQLNFRGGDMRKKFDEMMKGFTDGLLTGAIGYNFGGELLAKRPSYNQLLEILAKTERQLQVTYERADHFEMEFNKQLKENERLSQDNWKLMDENKRLSNENGNIQSENEFLKIRLENSQDDLTRCTEDKERLEEEKKKWEEDRRKLEQDMKDLQHQATQLQEQKDEIQKQYNDAQASIKTKDQQIVDLSAEIKTLKDKIVIETSAAAAAREDLKIAKKELIDSQEHNASLNNTITKLEYDWAMHQKEDILRAEDHAAEVEKLTRRYVVAESELAECQLIVRMLVAKEEELTKDLKDAKSLLEDKDETIEGLESDIIGLGLQIEKLTVKIVAEEERYQELESLKTMLENEILDAQQGIDSLQELNKRLTEEIVKLKEDALLGSGSAEAIERCQERCRTLEQLVRDLQAEIVTLRQRINLLDPDNAFPPLAQTTSLKFTFNLGSLVTTTVALTNITDTHTLFRSGSRWLDIAPDDPAFRSGTHIVQPDHRDNPPPAHSVQTIKFLDKFTEIPTVVVWLTAVQMSTDRRWRLKTYATDITTVGFDLHIESWADSYLVAAGASWVAYEKAGLVTGNFRAIERGGWKIPIGLKEGVVVWPSKFREPPRVLLGVREIQCDAEAKMGLQIGGDEKEGDMRWIVTAKPDGGRVFAVDGIYVAMEVE